MFDFYTYLVYISLLLSVLVLTSLASIKYKKSIDEIEIYQNDKLIYYHFIALLLISFVVGFRYNVGNDWTFYKRYFEYFSYRSKMPFKYELSYFYINKFIAMLGGGYEIMFFIVALISWCFIFKSINVMLIPWFIFFIFSEEFLFWSMNGVRQFVAIAIFIYSIKYIINRSLIYYFLLILLASSFHISVLFLLPLYFIPFQKLYNQKIWTIIFLVSLLFPNTPFLKDGLISIFSYILNKFPIFSGYSIFVEIDKYRYIGSVRGLGYIFKIIISLVIIFFSKEIILKYPKTKIYFILYLIGAVIFNLFYLLQPIIRFDNYFIIFRSFLLALIVWHLLRKNNYRLIPIGIVFLYFVLFLATIYQSSNKCSPYRFSFMQ